MATARSIAQVSQDSVRLERVRGTVQTVFPIRGCMPPTANQSETQDYGRVGSDGPIEGATKVFQVTLRETTIPENRSSNIVGGDHVSCRQHRINAYFYDKWADDHHPRIGPGDEIEVSGPAARLVRPDPSAIENGDHPFCLIFYTGDDDDLLALSAVAASHAGGAAVENAVSCTVMRKAAGHVGGAGSRGGAAGAGRGRRGGGGQGRSGGGRNAKAPYVYTSLDSLRMQQERANVYGIVCSFTHRHQSRGRDMTNSISLLDETSTESDSAVPCNFFSPTAKGLPTPAMVGDIVRIHRAKVQEYRGRLQLASSGGAAWLVIRKKQAVREAFQRAPVKVCIRTGNTSGGGGGDVDDEDPDPDEDSPPSGPDAGGGEVDEVLPASEWEVEASSANYTLSQVDQDRCEELSAWLAKKSEHLWLKPSSEVKVWVQDIFRRPHSGPTISEFEVDLVCCLVSKHEKSGGGSGSIENIYVVDGTGFASSVGTGEWAHRRDAAFLKGVRAALGDSAWTPANPRPSPVPAHLKVEVVENKKEWEALVMSPGMWVRLRRLTISKNRATGTMSAKMKDKTSSVNPLHPSVGEVQHIAKNYAAHCGGQRASSSGMADGGDNTNSGGAGKEPLSRTSPRPSSAPESLPAGAQQTGTVTVPPGAGAPQMLPSHGVGESSNSGSGGDIPPSDPATRGAGAPARGGFGERRVGGAASGTATTAAAGRGNEAGGVTTPSGVEANSSAPVNGAQNPPLVSPPAPHGTGSTTQWHGAAPAPRIVPYPGRGRDGGVAGHTRRVSPNAVGKLASFNKAGMVEVHSRREAERGTKRPLPVSGEGTGAGAEGGEEASTLPGGGRVSNLGVVRSTAAPSVFDTRARVVSHWPSKVENFVRTGPRWGDGPRFLFTLRLEDDHGVVEAVAAGPDASRLLPGSPSPKEFLASHEVRARTGRVLARIEAAAADGGEGGGRIALRLRSYVTPLVEIRHRGEKCKRYSVIAPSCLEEDGAGDPDAQGKG